MKFACIISIRREFAVVLIISPFHLYRKLSCSGQSDCPAFSPNDKVHSVLSGESFRMKLSSEVKNSPNIWKNPFSVTYLTDERSRLYSSLKPFFKKFSAGSPSMKGSFSSRLKKCYMN